MLFQAVANTRIDVNSNNRVFLPPGMRKEEKKETRTITEIYCTVFSRECSKNCITYPSDSHII